MGALARRRRGRAGGAAAACLACLVLAAVWLEAQRPRAGLRDAGLEPVAVALSAYEMAAMEREARTAALDLPPLPAFVPGSVFVGHLSPDTDSISSALAAAHLFRGKAMRAGRVNRETRFLLDHFGVEAPSLLDEAYRGEPFVLLDHNAYAQRAKILNATKIQGIFDHHAISATPTLVVTPIYVNIRPWGSCATVIATKYLEYKRPMPPKIAGILMGGVLSDTLNLKSPTATAWDEKVLYWLASKLHWADGRGQRVLGAQLSDRALRRAVKRFAHHQFQAKANTTGLSLHQIALLDFKTYFLRSKGAYGHRLVMGWGTIETVKPFYEHYLRKDMLQELALEVMPRIRKDRDLEAVFISIVNIEKDRSVVVCSTREDCDLLERAFPDAKRTGVARAVHAEVLTTSPRVSRKDEFIPYVQRVLQETTVRSSIEDSDDGSGGTGL